MKNYILDGQYIKYFNLLGIDIKKKSLIKCIYHSIFLIKITHL